MVLWLPRSASYQHSRRRRARRLRRDRRRRARSPGTRCSSLILLAGGTSLLVGNAYHAQMPEFAHHLGHYEADFTYGMLLGADAAGALVAGLALESRGFLARARGAFTLAMLWCAVIVGFAMTRSYALAVALLSSPAFRARVQRHGADAGPASRARPIRGRVIGLYAMSALGMRTFSGVSVGLGGSLIGIHASLALSAAALLALLALGLACDKMAVVSTAMQALAGSPKPGRLQPAQAAVAEACLPAHPRRRP